MVICAVDGKYSLWSQWSACSKSCDYGIQTRKRTCTSPEPQHGGRDCTDLGDPEHLRPCQVIACPSKLKIGENLGIFSIDIRTNDFASYPAANRLDYGLSSRGDFPVQFNFSVCNRHLVQNCQSNRKF